MERNDRVVATEAAWAPSQVVSPQASQALPGRTTVLTVLACAGVALALIGRFPHRSRLQVVGAELPMPSWTLWSSAIQALGIAVVSGCSLIVLWRRSQSDRRERRVWLAFTFALAAITAESLFRLCSAALLTAGIVTPVSATHVVIGGMSLIACVGTYQGLIGWNRYRTKVADPGDWLNGISSVFAAVALGNLIVRWCHLPLAGWQTWELQFWLMRVGAVFVVLGTAPTVARIAGLSSDLRLWLVSSAFTGVVLFQAITELPSTRAATAPWLDLVWVAAVAAVAHCAVRPAARVQPQGGSTQALTAGALFILLVAVAVLVLDTEFGRHGSHLTTIFAVVAVIGVSGRIAHLITDLANLAQTRQDALTDELTGIPNRRALVQHLQQGRPSGAELSLLIIDLDQFKAVNDRLGHAMGDQLLQQVATRLSSQIPRDGFLARLGGDEFAVVFDHSGTSGLETEDILSQTEDILAAACTPVVIGGRRLQVGASIGLAVMTKQSTDESDEIDGGELLRRADAAMYLAKAAGGGIRRYDSSIDARAEMRSDLADELRVILAADADPIALRGQIIVYYQPQMDLGTNSLVGAEALVRWLHPRLGLLSPDRFLDIVEELGLMGALTTHVLGQATEWARSWQERGRPLRVSVNLSTSCLVNPELIPYLDHVLAASGLRPALLLLEVTETDVMTNPDRALETLRAIRERRVGVSIDDYGTGYSSLAYLNMLPADELKLDRSFLTGLLTDSRTREIIAATIDLAHRLGLRLVAEGVEDLPTLTALSDLGCDETQGYLHSRPLPMEEMNGWIQNLPIASPQDPVYLQPVLL